MEIIKNNGKIVIEEYKEIQGFISTKILKSYYITVLDLAGAEKLKGRLIVQQLETRKNYRFTGNLRKAHSFKYGVDSKIFYN